MTVPSLLPPYNATAFMRALEQAVAYEGRVSDSVALIRDIKGRQLPSFIPFLLYEYGLIELTPYVPNYYTLLLEGRMWQIERDTLAAIHRGLGWVNAPATIEEAPTRRIWWNSFQLRFETLPPDDTPSLDRIDRITQLGKPFRSDFRRGVFEYDAPAMELDGRRLDSCLLDRESGVLLRQNGPLWSFGRTTELEHVLTQAEGTAIGNWLPPVTHSAYSVDLINLTAVIDDDGVPIDDAITFARATTKWHSNLAGLWTEFGVDVIATTDRGTLIEADGDRLSQFALDFNPLEDVAAAVVDEIGIDDPFGGIGAIRVTFTADAGRTFLVPASGLEPNTVYSVSFFARLMSSTGVTAGGGDAGFDDLFGQLVTGEYVRVEGVSFETGEIAGEWMDLTLNNPGAVLTVDLYGFQIEAGDLVTSPIAGPDITGHRAEDELTLNIPDGLNNVVARFDDGSAQAFLGVIGPFSIVPSELFRPLIVSIANASASRWAEMPYPWTQATFPWASDAEAQRQIVLAEWFNGKVAHVALKDADGAVIGYRRTRAVRQVNPSFIGDYVFDGVTYGSDVGGQYAYIEAMTDADNGAGIQAKSFEVIIDATVADGVKPGKLWLTPGQLSGGHAIAATPIDVPLRATVRERLKLLLRF
jgi:hypothetical protein